MLTRVAAPALLVPGLALGLTGRDAAQACSLSVLVGAGADEVAC